MAMRPRLLSLSFAVASWVCFSPETTRAEEPPAPPDDVVVAARPEGTLARPSGGVQHPDLDKAWAVYEVAVDKAAEEIRAAVEKQFEKAAADGNLPGVKKWKALGEAFDEQGTVPAEKETEKVVKAATEAFSKASEDLKRAYEQTIKALTKQAVKDKAMVEEAEKVDAEWKSLAAQAVLQPKPGAAERSAFLPKEGCYEFTQHDGARFLVEVKGDSVAITSWIKREGEQWWEEKPEKTRLSQRGGELHADHLAFNTEQLRWNAKAGTAERDWIDGDKKGTAKCRVKVFAHPLLGKWRYRTQGGHVADVEFVADGTVLWHDRERDIKATKFWSQKNGSAVLVSDRRGEQGEKGWHVVHLPVARNEAECDDWFSGKGTARLRRIP